MLTNDQLYTIAAILGALAFLWIIIHYLTINGKMFQDSPGMRNYFAGASYD